MKQLTTVAIITVLFIISALYINNYLNKTSKDITTHIDNIESQARKGNWQSITQELQQSNANWNKVQRKWAMLIEHEEIDKIDSSFTKVSKYVETKNTNDLLSENSNLKMLLEHVPEMYKLNIKNIL